MAVDRTYSELRRLRTFDERFEYLALRGRVGESTFGFDRFLNQKFYTSAQWRQVRQEIILRDEGCDLGIVGHEIYDRIYIHHLRPMTVEDLKTGNPAVLDPEYLISTTHATHNAIHYGDLSLLTRTPTVRRPGDTKLW